jgi:uncharacterized protein (DUF305 family)
MTRRHVIIVLAGTAAVAAVVAVVMLAAGGGHPARTQDGPPVIQPGAPGESGRTLPPEELARLSAPPHNQADVLFVTQMIPHHAQALQMTALVPGRAEAPEIAVLARRIEQTQTEEIVQLERWLTDRDLSRPAPHASHPGHDALMPGMLNDEQLAQLEAARGGAFDRLFLELMISHHQGAVTMASTLYANGGGLEPASDRFARDVIADQNIEIARMRTLLASLAT